MSFERRLKIPAELRRLKPVEEALDEAIPLGGKAGDRMPELLANELEKLVSTAKAIIDSALKKQVYAHLLPLRILLDPYRTSNKSEADAEKARRLSYGGPVTRGGPSKQEGLGEATDREQTSGKYEITGYAS